MIKSARHVTPMQQASPVSVPERTGVTVVPAGANLRSPLPLAQPAPTQLVPLKQDATPLPPPQATPPSAVPQSRSAVLLPGRTLPASTIPQRESIPPSQQRVSDQSNAQSAPPPRPTTERVLGTFRDVTGETHPWSGDIVAALRTLKVKQIRSGTVSHGSMTITRALNRVLE